RCLGSDRYRHLRGPICQCRPIRQDYLDELVWEQVMRLLTRLSQLEGVMAREGAPNGHHG
ncbi:MAG TPA: hypothetical protein VI114_13455, partial [Chthoniobacterales bacterium]